MVGSIIATSLGGSTGKPKVAAGISNAFASVLSRPSEQLVVSQDVSYRSDGGAESASDATHCRQEARCRAAASSGKAHGLGSAHEAESQLTPDASRV